LSQRLGNGTLLNDSVVNVAATAAAAAGTCSGYNLFRLYSERSAPMHDALPL